MLHGIYRVKKSVYNKTHSTTSKSCRIFVCCLNLNCILFLSCSSSQCLQGAFAEKTPAAYYFWLTATCEAGNQWLPTLLLSTEYWSIQCTIVTIGGAGLCNFCFLYLITCQAVEHINENLAPVVQIYMGLSWPLDVFEQLAMSSVHCCETQINMCIFWKE